MYNIHVTIYYFVYDWELIFDALPLKIEGFLLQGQIDFFEAFCIVLGYELTHF